MLASSAGRLWNGEPIQARTDWTSVSSTQHVRSIMCAPFINHMPPPVARSRNHGKRLATPKFLYQVSVANTALPTSPLWRISRARTVDAK